MAANQGTVTRQSQDHVGQDDLKVNALILAFWKHAEGHYGNPRSESFTTELKNLHDALRPLRALYGRSKAKDFGPLALRAVREKMIEVGLSRSTINARINRIRRAFRWAVSIELIPPAVIQRSNRSLVCSGADRGQKSPRV